MFPVTTFEHMGESFDPSAAVAADHPMVALRPDLFSPDPPKKSPKKAST